MLEIHPNLLWIGHALDVRTPQPIFDLGITAVVDVAYEETCAQLPRQLIYCRFPLNDGGGNEPIVVSQTLQTVIRFLESNTKTLLACSAGMSRSPTIAAFALAYHLNETPDATIVKISELKGLELKQALWDDVLSAFQELRPRPKSEG